MKITYEYNPNLMDNHYLVRAGVHQYVWFDNYREALSFMLSGNIDPRFEQKVVMPAA
jgi:hypothetical protein